MPEMDVYSVAADEFEKTGQANCVFELINARWKCIKRLRGRLRSV